MSEAVQIEDLDQTEKKEVERIQKSTNETGHNIDVRPEGNPLHLVGVMGEAMGQTIRGTVEDTSDLENVAGDIPSNELIAIREKRESMKKHGS